MRSGSRHCVHRHVRLSRSGVVAVHLLSHTQLFATLWTAACQASLSFTISWNLLKLMSIEHFSPEFFVVGVQSLSHVQLFVTPWTIACQASLSITNSRSLPKLMSVELVMPYNHLILCRPLLPSLFPSIRVFSNESTFRIRWPKYWSFSFSISPPK